MSGDHNQYQKDKSYLDQQDSLCPKCGLLSWSGHRCAAILEREEHMNPQPKALVLADALEELDVQFSHTGLCGEAADELRRLHEVNAELLRFAALVAAEEREACAKACEERQEVFEKYYTKGLAAMCAAAIRARGEQ